MVEIVENRDGVEDYLTVFLSLKNADKLKIHLNKLQA